MLSVTTSNLDNCATEIIIATYHGIVGVYVYQPREGKPFTRLNIIFDGRVYYKTYFKLYTTRYLVTLANDLAHLAFLQSFKIRIPPEPPKGPENRSVKSGSFKKDLFVTIIWFSLVGFAANIFFKWFY